MEPRSGSRPVVWIVAAALLSAVLTAGASAALASRPPLTPTVDAAAAAPQAATSSTLELPPLGAGEQSVWVGASDVSGTSSQFQYEYATDCTRKGTGGSGAIAEVSVPHGATLRRVTVLYKDNDPEDPFEWNVTTYLYRHQRDDLPRAEEPTPFQLASTRGNGTYDYQVAVGAVHASNAVVDAVTHTYALQVLLDEFEYFCGARIEYVPPAGQVVQPLTPCAIFDSRPGRGGLGRDLNPNEIVLVTGVRKSYATQGGSPTSCGIPSNATGLVLAVHVTSSAANGYVRLWPTGVTQPTDGVLWFTAADRASTTVPTVLGSSKRISIRNVASGATGIQLVAVGYTVAPPAG